MKCSVKSVFILFNLWMLLCVLGFTKVAEAQKEMRITAPKIDSVEIDQSAIPLPFTPKFFDDKMADKFIMPHTMKSYFIQEEKGMTNISTDYFDEKGQKILNVQMLAKNGVVFKYTMRYKMGKKETYVIAEKEQSFSSIYSSSHETAKAWVFEFLIPSIRWKDEIQARHAQYFNFFSKG